MQLYMVTNDCEMAGYVTENGVDRVMVDCESIGKAERQGHLDSLISQHTIEDVKCVRTSVKNGQLMVRTNPIHTGSEREIKSIIDAGADVLMLPMFRSRKEVERFIELVDSQVMTNLLVETKQALEMTEVISEIGGVDEIHFGLNDLHLDFGLKFMFEIVSRNLLEHACRTYANRGVPFGIGGIARIGQGSIPAELVLCEHVRLKSKAVILSRSFHEKSENLTDLKKKLDFPLEIKKLREFYGVMNREPQEVLLKNHQLFVESVNSMVLSQ